MAWKSTLLLALAACYGVGSTLASPVAVRNVTRPAAAPAYASNVEFDNVQASRASACLHVIGGLMIGVVVISLVGVCVAAWAKYSRKIQAKVQPNKARPTPQVLPAMPRQMSNVAKGMPAIAVHTLCDRVEMCPYP